MTLAEKATEMSNKLDQLSTDLQTSTQSIKEDIAAIRANPTDLSPLDAIETKIDSLDNTAKGLKDAVDPPTPS